MLRGVQYISDRTARAVIAMVVSEQYKKASYIKHSPAALRRSWHGFNVASVPVADAFGEALGCRAAVVPIRQFSETRFLEPDEDKSTFYSIDGLKFVPLDEGGSDPIPTATFVTRSGYAESRSLPRLVVRDPPRDHPELSDRMVYAYLQRSLEDEAEVLLGIACGVGAKADSAADVLQAPCWIDGATGHSIEDLPRQPASGLTCKGLRAAKSMMASRGFDGGRLVCYTTANALRDLASDPEFGDEAGESQEAASGCIREYDGILLVGRPPFAARPQGAHTAESQAAHSVMFVRGASFGLVCDDLVTVNETWQGGDKSLHFSATHKAGGVVKNADSVCCLLHA